MFTTLIFSMLGYLIGSLCSAVIVCQILKKPDPREGGSGNPGATNVLRLAGKEAALMTLASDVFKGLIPVWVAALFGAQGFGLALVGLAAFLGHVYPVFFGFKGGKGVATGLGVICGLSLFSGLLLVAIWAGVLYFSRYVSLASLVAAAIAPFLVVWQVGFMAFLVLCAMVGLLAYQHLENIERLRAGTEFKFTLAGIQ